MVLRKNLLNRIFELIAPLLKRINSLTKNNSSRCELAKHPVNNVEWRNCLSIQENSELARENINNREERPNCICNLSTEGNWSGCLVKAAIKSWGENYKNPKIYHIKKFQRGGQVRYMSTCD